MDQITAYLTALTELLSRFNLGTPFSGRQHKYWLLNIWGSSLGIGGGKGRSCRLTLPHAKKGLNISYVLDLRVLHHLHMNCAYNNCSDPRLQKHLAKVDPTVSR